MRWVISNNHELLDGLLTHQEQFAKRRDGYGSSVAASEESLLQEPLIKDNLQADSVFY